MLQRIISLVGGLFRTRPEDRLVAAYLARATDPADLERRLREVERMTQHPPLSSAPYGYGG